MPETQVLEQVEKLILSNQSDVQAETIRAPEPEPVVSLERESEVIISAKESGAPDAKTEFMQSEWIKVGAGKDSKDCKDSKDGKSFESVNLKQGRGKDSKVLVSSTGSIFSTKQSKKAKKRTKKIEANPNEATPVKL